MLSSILSFFQKGASSQNPPTLNISELSDVDQEQIIALLQDWENGEIQWIEQGETEPPLIRFIVEILPEILSDIAFLTAGKKFHLASVDIAVPGINSADITMSLRDLPLYKITANIYDTGEIPQETLAELIKQSALTHSVSQAVEAEGTIEGGAICVAPISVRRDGENLIIAD